MLDKLIELREQFKAGEIDANQLSEQFRFEMGKLLLLSAEDKAKQFDVIARHVIFELTNFDEGYVLDGGDCIGKDDDANHYLAEVVHMTLFGDKYYREFSNGFFI